ncbi:hypothetical protein FAZ19_11930 [Sphingobacterium alkalisoli]|uniref:Helicase C-terminal domain-containing protein n=1 Tax=Sphingobacterium alkalisoli TaxID=1874115 RepID=A0A4U0H2F8_9SPHI|nr:helicase-related protein [Sphingobacterium alkalisoli]TJY65821.1 hypothetical protein FAZ19_11930 [Sphingobacterium alkalisoli]GGH18113.1 hypothetical protein GCM10011418_21540 [Sphingobacterium alkalisoli]
MKLSHINKREGLENLVREQLIGPGAYKFKYHFQADLSTDNKDFEVIPEVPAYQYSTAILFPETESENEDSLKDVDGQEGDLDEVNRQDTSANNDEIGSDVSETLSSKQQNYPTDFGLSFVVNEDANVNNELDIVLSFRRYNRFTKKKIRELGYSILLFENQDDIERLVNQYLSQYLKIIRRDNLIFIGFGNDFDVDSFYKIDYVNLNSLISDIIVEPFKKLLGNDLVQLEEKSNVKYYGQNSSGKKYFAIGERKYGSENFAEVYTIYEDQFVDYFKQLLAGNCDSYEKIKEIINGFELYNQLKSIILDFKDVLKKNSPTHVWKSFSEKISLKLPVYTGGKIERFNPFPVSAEYPDLRFAVQYLRSAKNGGIYVKILISNKEKLFLKPNEFPALNKKDEANLKSYFGIELKVVEKVKNTLIRYNSPQFIAFDQEDNFNKLLYRNFEDYGEGYNTSINWSKLELNRFISTDFLPVQDSPSIGFSPSKITDNGVVSLLTDESVLSMRDLSTLSSIHDMEIAFKLHLFIDDYRSWIIAKRVELVNDPNAEILLNQLRSCEIDYNRLKRNVRLLESDSAAMAAFRLMNTAMFMQLHNSVLKKNNSSDLLNHKLDEEYYKTVFIEQPYRWRAFQLAFVLLNIDGFVKPDIGDSTIADIFETGWPERNEIADLVWFPAGGGKTEAYLGIIAFCINYRRFMKGALGNGTTVLMRYTLRLLTLQQFQRATILICALEVIRKANFEIPNNYSLGGAKITIGLFVGGDSLPNNWTGSGDRKGMKENLMDISEQISSHRKANKDIETIILKTNLPFVECPWCGSDLFIHESLLNVSPNHFNGRYRKESPVNICCNNKKCDFHNKGTFFGEGESIPFLLFDEDIYRFPPTLLFGTVDKFAALANKVSIKKEEVSKDSSRFFGRYNGIQTNFPPELIIQDELHLLLGPLGSAVGLFEKSLDSLCSYVDTHGTKVKPKVVTSTATTRNTDKQIFGLFNRRSEIFPKQGPSADDSFFAYYDRDEFNNYLSKRRYMGILPVGKTQVWMQLRVASVALAHRLQYLKANFSLEDIFNNTEEFKNAQSIFDYYHTVLSYFNSLKEVGKTQSQINHYLPGDVNYVVRNTVSWTFIDKLIRDDDKISYSELTGRLTGEEVKTNLTEIGQQLKLINVEENKIVLNSKLPPEFVISTNMISVGIDVSRFNTMIISSMPRNIAEYIQASSRVARDKEGIVFTVHHPFRSRDISHYQRFKEFHEKFYSYVEPISVTPFASKALDRYLPMYLAVVIRHNLEFGLTNNDNAIDVDNDVSNRILNYVEDEIRDVLENSVKLEKYLKCPTKPGFSTSIDGVISEELVTEVLVKSKKLLDNWQKLITESGENTFFYRKDTMPNESLFTTLTDNSRPLKWKVGHSLREVSPEVVIRTVQQ